METNDNGGDETYVRDSGRYKEAMKMLLPYRRPTHQGHPVDEAGFFSSVLFGWMTGLIWKLHKKPLKLEDLWETSKYDRAEPNCDKFTRLWNDQLKLQGLQKASIAKACFNFIKTRFILCAICVILLTVCQFISNGIIVRMILEYVGDGEDPNTKYGIGLVVAMACAESLRALLLSTLFAVSYRLGVRLRAGLLLSVFKKVLLIPPSHSTNVGEIVNMCSNDGDRVFEAAYSCTLILSGPVMFIVGTIYCGIIIGPVAIAGCFVFVLVFPIQGVIVKYTNKWRQEAITFTDSRVKCISEVLASIKLIKMYSWEQSFNKVVGEIRSQEKTRLIKAMFMQSINIAIASGTPIIATVFTILASIAVGTDLSPPQAFTLVTVYNVMAFALKVTPLAIKSVAEAAVSLTRFRKILVQLSFENYVDELSTSSENVIEVQDGSFSWQVVADEEKKQKAKKHHKNGLKRDDPNRESQRKLLQTNGTVSDNGAEDIMCLKKINFNVKVGTVVGICGNVGSGKSSLFSAILSQMRLRGGKVGVRGSTAYCSQSAWIMNSTIRENILFGREYDAKKYNKIVKACCLKPDFETFTSGDLTEVGERGINLSGGQKQRISLARAVYRDSDIFLLDDPLSAVDAHVGKNLFSHVIMGLLREKTVLIVTHQLQYLPNCDMCVYMADGKIEEIGTHAELMVGGEHYCEMYNLWAQRKEDSGESEVKITRQRVASECPSVNQSTVADDEDRLEEGRIIEKESSKQGVVSAKTYKRYLDAAGGWCSLFNVLFLSLLFTACFQFTTAWLAYWLSLGSGEHTNSTNKLTIPSYSASTSGNSTNSILDNPNLGFYMLVYGFSILVMIIVGIFRGYVFVYLGIKASHRLHNEFFRKILDGTMEFFDTTPAGRIINRFQKDQDMLDTAIPFMTDMSMMLSFLLLSCIAFIAVIYPYFLILLLILIPIFVLMMYIFRDAVREMKRLDNLSRSPWLSNIVTSIVGVPTIRAYGRTKDFVKTFAKLFNIQCIPYFLFNCIMSWLSVRLDFITISIAVTCSALVVAMKGVIPPAMAGLALSSALLMSGLFQFTVRNTIELEAQFIAADRIIEYLDIIPQEPKKKKMKKVNKDEWPQKAVVEFKNVEMRYRENLPLVLKGVSFKLNGKENIGVVGRTGSGKSSLAVSLFRLVEISGGQILIDGVDVSKISLEDLRPALGIIPQDPVLFTGSIRYNLDPFNQYHDEDIWSALECTFLKDTVDAMPKRLDTMIMDNGNNLSMGERQLMCLARAVLRKSKIIVLDEATAAIDAETDVAVQHTIRSHFTESTLLIIAHRLHTVMECDRVLVMDNGQVVEFDTPKNLSENPQSHLSKLLASSSGGNA